MHTLSCGAYTSGMGSGLFSFSVDTFLRIKSKKAKNKMQGDLLSFCALQKIIIIT